MAFKFLLFHLITAMVAINLIFADEESEKSPFFSFFGGGANSSGGLPNLPSLPNLPFFGSFGSGLVPSFFESRQERSADPQESNEEEQQERLFFGSIVSCNYTTQGGTRCSGCRTSLACYPNNVGRVRTCRGFLRYCNNGRCSFSPGSECSSTNSTTNSTG